MLAARLPNRRELVLGLVSVVGLIAGVFFAVGWQVVLGIGVVG
jgi:hypothetical protein